MFTTNKRNPQSDDETRNEFMEGNTLFLIGSKNGIGETDDTKDQFGLMPYLSEDRSQSVYILNVTRYHGLSKKLEENPQKLEDALKVMEILSPWKERLEKTIRSIKFRGGGVPKRRPLK